MTRSRLAAARNASPYGGRRRSASRLDRAAALAIVLLARPSFALQDDRLDWGRQDTHLHLGVGFGAAFLMTEGLERLWDVKPWKATAASSLAVAAASLVKEYAVDDFASGNDLMAGGIGIGANVMAQFAIHFAWTGSSGPGDSPRQLSAANR